MADRYPVPAGEHRTREELSRSRFLTVVAPAPDEAAAHGLVARARAEWPDATHHCWAFAVGAPGSTGRVGMSDDGEPHGTAGRPMLAALLHSGLGDVAAVVTRYYGGTKLGTGGLVRAYGGCVQRAVAGVARAERVTWARWRVAVGYADVDAVRQLVALHGGRVEGEAYGAEVAYEVALPAETQAAFGAAVRDATRGRARVEEA